MCSYVDSPHVVAGWSCHNCRTYNGLQRKNCRGCDGARCAPLKPDEQTGKKFETYEEAYKNDPEMLSEIHAQLKREA